MGHKYTKIIGSTAAEDESCLFLGSIDWVIEDEILDDLSIQAIVSVLPNRPQYVGEVLEKHGIPEADYLVYPLEDSTDEYISLFSQPDILSVGEFIHNRQLQGKNVLVHCDAGITRSAAVVVSYLMMYGTKVHEPQHLSFRESKAIVQVACARVSIVISHEVQGESLPGPLNNTSHK